MTSLGGRVETGTSGKTFCSDSAQRRREKEKTKVEKRTEEYNKGK